MTESNLSRLYVRRNSPSASPRHRSFHRGSLTGAFGHLQTYDRPKIRHANDRFEGLAAIADGHSKVLILRSGRPRAGGACRPRPWAVRLQCHQPKRCWRQPARGGFKVEWPVHFSRSRALNSSRNAEFGGSAACQTAAGDLGELHRNDRTSIRPRRRTLRATSLAS
jgi:hypothetical protein